MERSFASRGLYARCWQVPLCILAELAWSPWRGKASSHKSHAHADIQMACKG